VTSATRTYQVTGRPWAIADILAVAAAIAAAQLELLTAVEVALGPASLERARLLLAADTAERRP
jgi:hypothetical protein